VRFAVTGEENLQVGATNLQSLASAFKAVGDLKVGDNLAKGLTTPGEAAKYAAGELEKLKLRFKVLNETAVASTAKFQGQSAFNSGDLQNLAGRRKAIEEVIKERNAVQARIEGLERAGGLARAMSGSAGGAGGAGFISQVTAAEKALTPASNAAAAALQAQDAVVRQKIAAMHGLTAATKGTAAAEKA
jgi:hypothetical protein